MQDLGRRVIIVADDLTGALDSAAPFAQCGFPTIVQALNEAPAPGFLEAARIVCVDSESRHLNREAAARKVRALAARLPTQGAVVFKKVDSTLRGNVVSETLALMDACARRAAVVAPAFPAQGRTVRAGVVYVQGVPLAQTEFARDALSPAPTAPLAELFSAALPAAEVVIAQAGTVLRMKYGATQIWIIDAQDDADLTATVKAVEPMLSEVVLVGSAGLTSALARHWASSAALVTATVPPAVGAVLFVVGSRAPRSAEQVDGLRALPGTLVVAAPNGEVDARALRACIRAESPAYIVLQATAAAPAQTADQVAASLASATIGLVSETLIGAIVATGGDTAKAILRALRHAWVKVSGELMPGIARTEIWAAGRKISFVTKAGGFGQRDAFTRIAVALGARRSA